MPRMFAISNDALTSLCNALFSLQGWFGILEHFGLASEEEYQEMKYFGDQYRGGEEGFFSWNNLYSHLDLQDNEIAPRVQALCTDLLGRKDKYAEKADDEDKFLNALAEFEVRLGLRCARPSRVGSPASKYFQRAVNTTATKP